jgi:hypothetical protein
MKKYYFICYQATYKTKEVCYFNAVIEGSPIDFISKCRDSETEEPLFSDHVVTMIHEITKDEHERSLDEYY